MLGAIIGDTVGSVYEFHNIYEYNFEFLTEASSFTDDTVMTFAVANWLLIDPTHSYAELERSLVDFGEKYPYPHGGYGGGFKIWLFRPESLRSYNSEYGSAPYVSSTGRHPYGSWGNGSAMRVSAVGWFFETLDETEEVAAISAAITHNHPEGIKGAKATAAVIWMARNGKSKAEIKEYIMTKYGYPLDVPFSSLHNLYGWEDSCQGTVPPAIIIFLESTDYEDAIRKAVQQGGDTDTLASIVGGMAEAFYKSIPKEHHDMMLDKLPEEFKTILEAMRTKSYYNY